MSDSKEKIPVVPRFSSFKKSESAPGSGGKNGVGKPSGGSQSRKNSDDHDKPQYKPAVPVFSSFKPKGPPEPSTSGGDQAERPSSSNRKHSPLHGSSRDEKRSRDSKHRHREPRHEKSHRPEGSSRGRERPSSPKPPRPPRPSPRPGSRQPDLGSECCLFVIDTKGDPLVHKYGSIDKSTVPRYQRYGHGRVLGSSGRLAVHHEGSREEAILRFPGQEKPDWRNRNGNLLRSKAFHVGPDAKRVRSRIGAPAGQVATSPDFVAFSTCKKRKRGGDGHESSEEEQPDYRSIMGKAKARDFDDAESDLESGSSIHGDDDDGPLKQKSVLLSRRVKDNPDDTEAWLALVDHQDILMRSGEGPDHEVLKDKAHSFSEIKVHMLEAALRHAKSSHATERIIPRLMREGNKVWSPQKTAKKWREALQGHEGSFPCWLAFLDWSLSNLSDVSAYDSTKQLFTSRLGFLSRSSAGKELQDLVAVYSESIYVFLRATRFIHDAGYREVAVAAWQAQLEMNLMRPSGLAGDHAAVLAKFRDFWESEAPRLGEQRKQGDGWRAYEEDPRLQDAPEARALVVPIDDAAPAALNGGCYEAWAHAERRAAQRCRMPARVEDADAADDPLRVVMFSDIEDLVFVMPPQLPRTLTEQLIDGYLIFCHAPPAWGGSFWTRSAYDDQFLVTQLRSLAHEVSHPAVDDAGADRPLSRKLDFTRDGCRMAISPWVLFPGASWFRYMANADSDDDGDNDDDGRHVDGGEAPIVDYRWTRETIGELTREVDNVGALAPYCLAAWQDTGGGSGLRKRAKALLGKYPDNVPLYSTFALAELAEGHEDRATNILSAGLKFCGSEESAMLLWQTWAWVLFTKGDRLDGVVARLCCSTGGAPSDQPPSSVHVLRAREVFASKRAGHLREGNHDMAGRYGECLVLLEYAAAGGGGGPETASEAQGNISAAMASARECSEEMGRLRHGATASHERLLQFAAQLLYVHTSRGPYRRAFANELATHFLRHFPRNSIFQSLFFWSQPGFRTNAYQARAVFSDMALSPAQDCATSRAAAIMHELSGGNEHRARAAFEHALASDACGLAPALWRNYLRFCGSRGRQHRPWLVKKGAKGEAAGRTKGGMAGPGDDGGSGGGKLKDVFYRAVAKCPWHKDIVLELSTTGLLGEIDRADLEEIFLGMEARGVRMHVGIGNYLHVRE